MCLLLKNVRKSYRQGDGTLIPILKISHFEMQPGEQVALIGESGGGKTTLLNVIAGITSPDSGEVLVNNTDIARIPEAARDQFRARNIGIVFQTFQLLPAFTALENVLLGMSFSGQKVDRKRATDLLGWVGLGHRLHNRPTMLSVGEQQRVAVARALANRPKLLLADEPTASVDATHQTKILELLRNAAREQQCALLLVTHSGDVSSQFERVEKLSAFNHPDSSVSPVAISR